MFKPVEKDLQASAREGGPGHGPIMALIPAYNEQRFIGSVVLAARPHVDKVVVVDDGSHDGTAEIAESAGATVLRHEVNQGKAAAVNTGLKHMRRLKPCAVVLLDGDGQHCAADIPAVLQPIVDGTADVVVGSRFLGVRSTIPLHRRAGQHGLTALTNLASGVQVSDSQSGFRAFSCAAVEVLSFAQAGFAIESEMQFLVREHRLRVLEAPIKVTYAEKAKRSPVRHGIQVTNSILRLAGQGRPLLVFWLAGGVAILAALALAFDVVEIYRASQTVAMARAVLAAALGMVGALLFILGVVLHSLRAMLLDLRRALLERLR